ncbi:hypothetical protein Tco_1228436 [Tanacetum coccineum]
MAQLSGIAVYNMVFVIALMFTVGMITSVKGDVCTDFIPFPPKWCDGDDFVSDDCWDACRRKYEFLVKATCGYFPTFPGRFANPNSSWVNHTSSFSDVRVSTVAQSSLRCRRSWCVALVSLVLWSNQNQMNILLLLLLKIAIYSSELLILSAHASSIPPLLSLPLSMACDDRDGPLAAGLFVVVQYGVEFSFLVSIVYCFLDMNTKRKAIPRVDNTHIPYSSQIVSCDDTIEFARKLPCVDVCRRLPKLGIQNHPTRLWARKPLLKSEKKRVNLENESLKDEISDLKKVIEKWTCSKVTLDQLLSEQVPEKIINALGGKAPEITSGSESECETREPLPPLPKLIGA